MELHTESRAELQEGRREGRDASPIRCAAVAQLHSRTRGEAVVWTFDHYRRLDKLDARDTRRGQLQSKEIRGPSPQPQSRCDDGAGEEVIRAGGLVRGGNFRRWLLLGQVQHVVCRVDHAPTAGRRARRQCASLGDAHVQTKRVACPLHHAHQRQQIVAFLTDRRVRAHEWRQKPRKVALARHSAATFALTKRWITRQQAGELRPGLLCLDAFCRFLRRRSLRRAHTLWRGRKRRSGGCWYKGRCLARFGSEWTLQGLACGAACFAAVFVLAHLWMGIHQLRARQAVHFFRQERRQLACGVVQTLLVGAAVIAVRIICIPRAVVVAARQISLASKVEVAVALVNATFVEHAATTVIAAV